MALISNNARDPVAQRLLYTAEVNFRVFDENRVALHQHAGRLNSANFARSQSSGIFEAERLTAQMEESKVSAIGHLVVAVTAAHRFIRSVMRARSREMKMCPRDDRKALADEWKEVRERIDRLEEPYKNVRNTLEHLYDGIYGDPDINDENVTLTIEDTFRYRDEGGTPGEFDFSAGSLVQLDELHTALFDLLGGREALRAQDPMGT